jgi:hypothetical protein
MIMNGMHSTTGTLQYEVPLHCVSEAYDQSVQKALWRCELIAGLAEKLRIEPDQLGSLVLSDYMSTDEPTGTPQVFKCKQLA